MLRPYRDYFVVGDFDGDGHDDLLGADRDNNGWTTWFRYGANGNWQWVDSDHGQRNDPLIPILLVSGHVGNLERMTAMDERTAFVQKPFKADRLLAELRRVLDHRAAP